MVTKMEESLLEVLQIFYTKFWLLISRGLNEHLTMKSNIAKSLNKFYFQENEKKTTN